jgi:hypothetical protein
MVVPVIVECQTDLHAVLVRLHTLRHSIHIFRNIGASTVDRIDAVHACKEEPAGFTLKRLHIYTVLTARMY